MGFERDSLCRGKIPIRLELANVSQFQVFSENDNPALLVSEVKDDQQHSVKPFIYTRLFLNPERCPQGEIHYRDEMPKETYRLTEAYRTRRCDGLYLHHVLIACRVFIAAIVVISLIFANVWAAKKDVGAGYAVGQYLLAIVPLIALFASNRYV